MATPSGLYIVCAPAGTDLGSAVDRLKKSLKPSQVFHRDLEYELCRSQAVREALQQAGVSRPPDFSGEWPTMYHDTWNLSRSKLTDLWQQIVRKSLSDLDDSGKPFKLLTGHLVYYGGRRDEFYSVVTAEPFLHRDSVGKSAVLLLIDDVYDMYLRLTEDKQLYAHADRLPHHLARMRREENLSAARGFSKDLESYFCTEWELGVMTHLLAWRHLEALTAENLALQLGAKFLTLSVKHPVSAASQWLANPNAISVYFSHPISRPRKEWRKKKRWHPVVREFSNLVCWLDGAKLVCVMPTAIDEYRIARPGGRVKKRALRRLPALDERWPVSFSPSSLLYEKPLRASDMSHANLLNAKIWDPHERKLKEWKGRASSAIGSREHSILLRALERQIQFQISSRDHLLVSHSDCLLVFRPFFQDGEWSGGVQAEIDHWVLLAKTDPKKKAVFVHFEEDVRDRARVENPARIELEVENTLVHIVEKGHHLSWEKAKEVLRKKGSAMLDSGTLPLSDLSQIHDLLPKYKEQARQDVLIRHFTGIDDPDPKRVAIIVVKSPYELKKMVPSIATYLKHGQSPPLDWSRVSKIFFSSLSHSSL